MQVEVVIGRYTVADLCNISTWLVDIFEQMTRLICCYNLIELAEKLASSLFSETDLCNKSADLSFGQTDLLKKLG